MPLKESNQNKDALRKEREKRRPNLALYAIIGIGVIYLILRVVLHLKAAE